MLRNDSNFIPPSWVEVVDLKEYPSVELGRACGERLLSEPADTGFWITDDFVALGLYDFFRSHGIDLNQTGRLLVNSSPTRLLTEELGIATIGFCPLHVGMTSADYFSEILKNPDEKFESLLIKPEANAPALRYAKVSDATA